MIIASCRPTASTSFLFYLSRSVAAWREHHEVVKFLAVLNAAEAGELRDSSDKL